MTTRTVTTLEYRARSTTKSLLADGFMPLKEVATRANMHPVTAKKALDQDGQTPTKLGRRCFYRIEQLDGLLTDRAYLQVSTQSNPEPVVVSFDANGSEPTE